jgi:ANTAR domain
LESNGRRRSAHRADCTSPPGRSALVPAPERGAVSVLISTYRIDADSAFDLLRQRSQRTNRKLPEVAVDVVNDASEGGAARGDCSDRR